MAALLCPACGLDLSSDYSNGRPSTAHAGGSETGRLTGITAAHNAIRAEVSASPPLQDLVWSADLAAVAQNYAEHLAGDCKLVHSGGDFGENLAFFSGETPAPARVVDLWASEKSCWTYGAFMAGDQCTNACNSSGGCGHYTQLVWRSTKLVGCGVAACGNGNSEIWVCNYDPPGNFVGETPY
jgi:pathogenesis-related protein 1